MNKEDIDQKHLELAVNHALAWFRNIPSLTHQAVCQRLVECITSQFRGYELLLTQFELIEISERSYKITVNHTASVRLQIRKDQTND